MIEKPPAFELQVVDQFSDKLWRLANLYYIIDDSGREVHFYPNDMQLLFLREMHYLNDILKGRQHGFTTLICLYILDECVFYPHVTGGVIAHTLDDVKKIFRRKIKNPYERLPDGIRAATAPTNDTVNEYVFGNKSEISVDTSMRSGTMQMLLISEFGQIALKFPEKAKEIKLGSFNTVHPGNYLFVESTGHGKGGEFFDLTMAARSLSRSGKPLSKMDFKYHFYPWWMNPKYALDSEEARHVVFTRKDSEYFANVELGINARIAKFGANEAWLIYWKEVLGGKLSMNQRAWYIKKRQWNGDDMKREYPSNENEPFEAILQGTLFGEQMAELRQQGRITRMRHEPSLAVHTWWDIGRRDKTAVWFFQMLGNELRFIWYEEKSFTGFPYWAKRLDALKTEQHFNYGNHLGPHDMNVTEWGVDKTRLQSAKDLGYNFTLGKQIHEKDQIEAARSTLPVCIFDEENAAVGITCLEQGRREWNDHLQMYAEGMRHDEYSHGCSSFMNGAAHLGSMMQGTARAMPVAQRRKAW